ncbi:YjbQ family protein [Candidatus Micrarchaeota archaeon]|nr:YjbQ family protein [Candidatus Micrarchaeota archaeon]
MEEIAVTSKKKAEAVDITEEIEKVVEKNKWREGILFIYLPHCTAALFINEFEPNIKEDYEKYFTELEKTDWKHNEIDDNAAAHIGNAVMGEQKFVFVQGGKLILGTWQRIILMELDGPRRRRILLKFVSVN